MSSRTGIAGPLGRRGALRGVVVLLLIAACLLAAYYLAKGDPATMGAAFLRRVRAMGQPQ